MWLIALATGAQAAGTVVWLSEGEPLAFPERTAVPRTELTAGDPLDAVDARALARLASELEAVIPLKDVFDGELQIIRRLELALADVRAVRPEDRPLIWRALVFQGYAVDRYFQDGLATEDAAADYRVEIGGAVVVRPWADAVAFDPDRQPAEGDIPDADPRVAFGDLRAELLFAERGQISVSALRSGEQLVVDGRDAVDQRMEVQPGMHWVTVGSGGRVQQRWQGRIAPGEEIEIPAIATPDELIALSERLATAPERVSLPQSVVTTLDGLEAPVSVVVVHRNTLLRYDREGGVLALEEAPPKERTLSVEIAAAGGWLYDGNYLLENPGAVETAATVNAGAAIVSAALRWQARPALALDVGLETWIPGGEGHTLPVGEGTQRVRLWPFVAAGHPRIGLAIGPLLPWHLAFGPRLRWPVGEGRLVLTGSAFWGMGITRVRAAGQPDFEPWRAQGASAGVGWVFGAR